MMTGEDPLCIDHINGDPSDNRWCNLRSVTQKENGRNLKLSKSCTTGHLGVIWYKPSQRWRVRISPEGQNIHIGMFDDYEEAVAARKAAEIKYGFHPNHGKR